jgi:membrane protein YdbS with pleckstrin-like domain
MARYGRLLGEGETLVHEFRPHGQALFWPATAFIATGFVASFLLGELGQGSRVPAGAQGVVHAVIVAAAIVSVVCLTLIPVAKWLSIRYLITDRRLITRWGIVTREGRDLPLARLTDVRYTAGPLQRMLGTGTMLVETMGDSGPLVMRCVPDVETVQRELFRLHEQRLHDPGGWLGPTSPAPAASPPAPGGSAQPQQGSADAVTERVDLTRGTQERFGGQRG